MNQKAITSSLLSNYFSKKSCFVVFFHEWNEWEKSIKQLFFQKFYAEQKIVSSEILEK